MASKGMGEKATAVGHTLAALVPTSQHKDAYNDTLLLPENVSRHLCQTSCRNTHSMHSSEKARKNNALHNKRKTASFCPSLGFHPHRAPQGTVQGSNAAYVPENTGSDLTRNRAVFKLRHPIKSLLSNNQFTLIVSCCVF